MKNLFLIPLITVLFTGCCSIVGTKYIPSVGEYYQSIPTQKLKVFYSKEEVPFKFKEIGRIYVKNYTYEAKFDPGKQIEKIKEEAAFKGATGVIIEKETHTETTFSVWGQAGSGRGGQICQYSGIAIVIDK